MLHDITKKQFQKGDTVKLSLQGVDVVGTIVATTVSNFIREYQVQFADGSKRWLLDYDFKHLKN